MKNRMLKFVLIVTMLIPALGVFLVSSPKVKAENYQLCGELATFEISSVTAEQYVNINGEINVPKVMPGDYIDITVKNHCNTNSIKYNLYIHPADVKPDGTNIEDYRKISDRVLYASKQFPEHIKIDGTGTPGDYKILVVAFQLGLTGEPEIKRLGAQSKSLRIATDGIEIKGSNSIVKDSSSNYVIKFYSNSGAKFSIFVDSTDVANRKAEDIVIPPGEEFTYSGFTWNTTGTEVGSHKIIVKLDNGRDASFDVEVTDPSTGGSTGESGGFSLTKLDTYNIKTLLNHCKSDDLERVTCMVTTVTDWLLDIGAVISFIMILYASIIYLTSYGEESKVELAKKTLIWSVIGVAVIGAAMAIMRIIENILNNPGSLT